MKIAELESQPGNSPKVKELLKQLKEAIDEPGDRETADVYRLFLELVMHFKASNTVEQEGAKNQENLLGVSSS